MRVISFVLVPWLALGITACTGTGGDEKPSASPGATKTSGCSTELDYVYDTSNIRLVAQYAEYIFTGKADKEVGSGTGPNYTDFSVSVDKTLKGQINGPITIRQNGTRDCPVRGEEILSVGASYIFAVNQGQSTKPLVMAYPVSDMAKVKDAIAHPETLQGPRNPRNP
ncbi:Uncharacterised protein [Mycobacteroides abscessus subsp. bolletii]|nr:Uncharacterised protein [Mycobacteroides abscessus subsp. bolletii]SKF70654.1 Uncharacterised protein [Mycobacteroides abscessus subsp. bolletii]SPX82221.1 Uncharacterised protein [Mycobacteroides abscessus]